MPSKVKQQADRQLFGSQFDEIPQNNIKTRSKQKESKLD